MLHPVVKVFSGSAFSLPTILAERGIRRASAIGFLRSYPPQLRHRAQVRLQYDKGREVVGRTGAESRPLHCVTFSLIPQAQLDQALANGIAQRAAIDNDQDAIDFRPVVKLLSAYADEARRHGHVVT